MADKILGKTGFIARYKPITKSGLVVLEELCENSDHVLLGLGSSNLYDIRNPFTVEESREMVDRSLRDKFDNYSFIDVPDFGHIPEYADGTKWKEYVVQAFAGIDFFICGNLYVNHLLKDEFNIIQSYKIVPPKRQVRVSATMIRVAMARDDPTWKDFVPKQIIEYLEDGRVERFKREFGMQTLAQALNHPNYGQRETLEQQRQKIVETSHG